jgi:hypothetical protein
MFILIFFIKTVQSYGRNQTRWTYVPTQYSDNVYFLSTLTFGFCSIFSLIAILRITWISCIPIKLKVRAVSMIFISSNKKEEIGNRKYWINYKKGIVTVKSGIKKVELRFKVDEKQVWLWHVSVKGLTHLISVYKTRPVYTKWLTHLTSA